MGGIFAQPPCFRVRRLPSSPSPANGARMTAHKSGDPTTLNRLYGRAKGKPLRKFQQSLVDDLLPRIAVPAEGEVTARYLPLLLYGITVGLAFGHALLLFRSGQHSAVLELELTRRGIPFVKYGGLKFLEAAHVKDLLSVLRWVQNPRGRLAGFRIAQLVPGLGPASARRLLDAMAGEGDAVQAMHAFKPPAAAAHDWREWLTAHAAIGDAGWPDALSLALRWRFGA